jgi:protein-S-isoprenylcysteine O-methyltransferase Ste14
MGDSAKPPLPFRWLLRVPVPWVFVLAYLAGMGLQRLLPRATYSPETLHILHSAGIALWIAAIAIAGWALILFHLRRTTTTPGEISKAFVAQGPYRWSRNPMYVGLTLAYLGEMSWQAQILPLLFLPLVIAYLQWVVIPLEEARLRESFGETYAAYCARVRRWL